MDDLDLCDGCLEPIGKYGWIKYTGEIDKELGVPIVEVYCSNCPPD